MLALAIQINYRQIELHADTDDQSVGVQLNSGELYYVKWLGFLTQRQAQSMPNARPVKLKISRYCQDYGQWPTWIDMAPGQFVQGCLVERGVYAVTIDSARIVTGHRSDRSALQPQSTQVRRQVP